MNLPTKKHCKKCDTTKPASEFSIAKSSYKGKTYYSLQSACKPCIVRRSVELVRLRPPKPRRKRSMLKETTFMQSPLTWKDMKGDSVVWNCREYPVCEEGHRYVGPECLPCKYSVYARTVV